MDDLIDILNAVAPVLVASGGIIAGLVALAKNLGRVRRIFSATDQTALVVDLRELADVRAEMNAELTTQLEAEKVAHAQAKRDLEFVRLLNDECERRLARIMMEIDR